MVTLADRSDSCLRRDFRSALLMDLAAGMHCPAPAIPPPHSLQFVSARNDINIIITISIVNIGDSTMLGHTLLTHPPSHLRIELVRFMSARCASTHIAKSPMHGK